MFVTRTNFDRLRSLRASLLAMRRTLRRIRTVMFAPPFFCTIMIVACAIGIFELALAFATHIEYNWGVRIIMSLAIAMATTQFVWWLLNLALRRLYRRASIGSLPLLQS